MQRPALVSISVILLVVLGSQWAPCEARGEHPLNRSRRSQDHHSKMHSHLSRKVFDRACAASKDTIDEIVACVTSSELVSKTIKEQASNGCYKDAFGMEFDMKDKDKHKELICKNRDKFENMTACMYHKIAGSMDQKEIDRLTESLVDVGLCIVNALDG